MKEFWLHFLKNCIITLTKLVLVVLFVVGCLSIGWLHLGVISSDYDNYVDLRGKANWMTEGTADLIEDKQEGNTVEYSYTVNDEKYLLQIDKNTLNTVDKTLNILYDRNKPEDSIAKVAVESIDTFYADSIKRACLYYIEIFVLGTLLGLCWWLLDYVKYNRKLWGIYV